MPYLLVSQEEPSKTVELFINLVSRHEQAFYSFIHKVQTKGEGLFNSLMQWIELFLTFVREGVSQSGEKLSLDFLLPHTGEERAKILKEVDAIALYHYKLKVAYEAKVRRRFLRQSGAAAEEEIATQTMVDDVIGELQFGSLIKGDTEEIYAEEEDEFSSDEYSDEYTTDDETSSEAGTGSATSSSHMHLHPLPPKSPSVPSPPRNDSSSDGLLSPVPRGSTTSPSSAGPSPPPKSSMDKPLPLPPAANHRGHSRNASRGSAISARGSSVGAPKLRKLKKAGQVMIEPPELTAIPELLPIFVELVRTTYAVV